MVILTMMVFVLINTYLLRQVKSIGMFLMIAALGLYFVAMNNLKAAGQGVTNKFTAGLYDNMFFRLFKCRASYRLGTSNINSTCDYWFCTEHVYKTL